MSWHCAFCESSDNDKTWTYVVVSFLDGGVPIKFVCHAECLKEKLSDNATYLQEQIQLEIEDSIELKEKIKNCG